MVKNFLEVVGVVVDVMEGMQIYINPNILMQKMLNKCKILNICMMDAKVLKINLWGGYFEHVLQNTMPHVHVLEKL